MYLLYLFLTVNTAARWNFAKMKVFTLFFTLHLLAADAKAIKLQKGLTRSREIPIDFSKINNIDSFEDKLFRGGAIGKYT